MHRFITFFCVSLFCLLSFGSLAATTQEASVAPLHESKRVLILSSYNISNEWSFLIERNFASHFLDKELEIQTEYLDLSPQLSYDVIKQKAVDVTNNYPEENKIIILLGEDAWIFYRTFLAAQWGHNPAIALFSGNYTVSLESYLSGKSYSEKKRIPLEESRQGMNATIIYDKIHVKETIDLMHELIPGIHSIALITDKRQIGTVTRLKFKQTMQQEFPSLKAITLSMRNLSTQQLTDSIQKLGPGTGIIFHSWYTAESDIKTSANNMKLTVGRLTHAPIFALYDSGVKEGILTGGCYPTIANISAALNSCVEQVLAGTSPSDIPVSMVPHAHNYLNYRNLDFYHIPRQLYPQNAIYYEKPLDNFEKNKRLILFVIIIAVLLACIFILLTRYKHKQLLSSRRIKEALERTNELQTAFIANMGHEIRTPLNAIVGFSSLLAEPDLLSKEDLKNSQRVLQENNDLLLQLIDDIMELSKIQSGVIEFTFETINIGAVVKDTVNTTTKKVKNPLVRIYCEENTTECFVQSDWKLLTQVMNNLMSNAIKYTPQGEIEVGYEVREESVYVFVKDTGIGIAAEDIGQIFDKFEKGSSHMQGTGVGLSLCRAIIQELGGEIGVSSQLEVGSTFWFTLPINQEKKDTKKSFYHFGRKKN